MWLWPFGASRLFLAALALLTVGFMAYDLGHRALSNGAFYNLCLRWFAILDFGLCIFSFDLFVLELHLWCIFSVTGLEFLVLKRCAFC